MWTIQLLGGLAAHSSQRELTRFRTQKAASMLAYLAYHPAPQPREMLLDLLWPDAEPEVGRHNLSNALSFLRHLLEPPGVPPGTVILADRASVRLNPAAVTVDAVEFESKLRQAQAEGLSEAERRSRLLEAVEWYQGALLPGYYEDWIAPEALRLEELFVQGVIHLVPLLLQAGKQEQALTYAQRAVSTDPLSEEATSGLMQAFSASGQSSQALRAYRQLGARLQEELNAQPSQELKHLAEQLGPKGASRTSPAVPENASPIEEGFARVSASRNRAVPPEPTGDTDVVHPVPPGRLLGAEFLLRTTTRFFGREEEIARLGNLLSTQRTRLVTLTGPGGTGKTRLALEAAAHLVERTQDAPSADVPTSAVFIPLAPLTEPERFFDVTLRSLGIVPASHQQPLDQLVSVLEACPNTLLILDNFEQLVEEGALLVHQLLGKSTGVKLLITSRQRLQIGGEREFHLAPLPTSAGEQTLEASLAVPSIALFVDRVQNAFPDFQLTERNAEVVTQLCDHLEGIPLAIELAAARMGVLTPARILEQVQANRLDFLVSRRRDAESRHKTLRATLDWSYALLPEVAQAFLAALSVFQDGWTLEAAEAVCELSEAETLELMTLLRDSSLIGVVDTEGGLRFTLLETIREYSQEKLRELGEDAAVRHRHRDYFAALAKQAEPELTGPDQVLWMDRLEIEHDNLCAALGWCESDARSAQVGLWLVGAMWHFWEVRGYLSLGRGYLTRALGSPEASASTPERGRALQVAGSLASIQGDYASSRALLEESLTILRALGDKGGIADSLHNLGNVTSNQGDYATTRTLYEESLTIRRALGDRAGIARSLINLGSMAYTQGDYATARTLYEESLTIRRELGDRRGIARSLYSLGLLAHIHDDSAAKSLYEESLVIMRELGDRAGISHSLNNLGIVALAQGDYATARTRYEESLLIRRELGDRASLAESLTNLGIVTHAQGDYATARTRYEESLTIQRELGHRAGIADSLYHLGNMVFEQGDYVAVRALYEESLTIRRELGDRAGIASSLSDLGLVACTQGDYGTAKRLYEESLNLRREIGNILTTASSLEDFANLTVWQGQFERAVRLLGAAEALRATLGRTVPVDETADYERMVDAAHAALNEEAFAAIWAEGQAMTLEQAVAYALE